MSAIHLQKVLFPMDHDWKYCISCLWIIRTWWIVISGVRNWHASGVSLLWGAHLEGELFGHGYPKYPSMPCCRPMPCVQECDETYRKIKRAQLLRENEANRRLKLTWMASSEGLFYSNGNSVCNNVLSTTFEIRNNMQISAREAMRSRLLHHDRLQENKPGPF